MKKQEENKKEPSMKFMSGNNRKLDCKSRFMLKPDPRCEGKKIKDIILFLIGNIQLKLRGKKYF